MKTLPFGAVVQYDVEAAGHRDNELMERLVRVTAALGAARDVVEVIDALNRKRNVAIAFDESQIPPRVGDFRQQDNLAVIYAGS